MAGKNEFSGDALLDFSDGRGELVLEDGLFKDCRDFSTAVCLSLFGGNKDDTKGLEKDTWWGNLIPGTKETERMKSEFSAAVDGTPLTSGNIRRAQEAAERDLSWIKSEAGAETIDVSVSAVNSHRVYLDTKMVMDGNTSENKFQMQWQGAE
jgi:phage gp46-like protein